MKKEGIQTRKRKQKSSSNNHSNNMVNNMNGSANDTLINPKSTKYSKNSSSSGSGRKSSKSNSMPNQVLIQTVGNSSQQSSTMGPTGINLIPPTSGNDGSIYIKTHGDENIHHQPHAIMAPNSEK